MSDVYIRGNFFLPHRGLNFGPLEPKAFVLPMNYTDPLSCQTYHHWSKQVYSTFRNQLWQSWGCWRWWAPLEVWRSDLWRPSWRRRSHGLGQWRLLWRRFPPGYETWKWSPHLQEWNHLQRQDDVMRTSIRVASFRYTRPVPGVKLWNHK